MPCFRKYLFLIVLMLFNSHINAQSNVIYQSEEKITIPVTFAASPEGYQISTNYFIGEIARCHQKKAEYTHFSYVFNQVFRVIEIQPGKYTATMEFTDLTCSGDVFYRGFPICDALVPDHCSFDFQVSGKQKLPLIDEKVNKASLQPGYNKPAQVTFTDTSITRTYHLKIARLDFSFDPLSTERFTSKLKLIDNYFLSGDLITNYRNQLASIDIGNAEMLMAYDIKLLDLEKAVEKLYQTDYPGKLHLASYDPVGFIDKFNVLSDSLILIRKQLNDKIGSLDKTYYIKGKKELEANELLKAQSYFERSVLFNANYAPSQFELAKIMLKRDSLYAASHRIAFILQKLNPDEVLRKEVLLFTDTLYQKMIAVGDEFVRQEKYNEAVGIFTLCNTFCADLPGYTCSAVNTKGLVKAKFGIYQSYLTVSQKALDNNKLELAEVYINEAMKYQKLHQADIISNAEAKLKLGKLVTAYLVKSDTLSSKQNFEKALQLIVKAKMICDSNQITVPERYNRSLFKAKDGMYKSLLKKSQQLLTAGNISQSEAVLNEAISFQRVNENVISASVIADSMLGKIKSVQYKENILTGKRYLSLFNYLSALTWFDKALELEQRFYFKPEPGLDSLIHASALPVAAEQIDKAMNLLFIQSIDSAELIRVEIQKNLFSHKLAAEAQLIDKIRTLDGLLFRTKCARQKTAFDSMYLAANYHIINQKYVQADEQLTQAIAIAETNRECNIDASYAISDKKMYVKNAGYQRLMNKANDALDEKNYPEYFFYYNDAESFYEANQLKNSGLMHTLLIERIGISPNTALILSVYHNFVLQNRLDEALVCVKTLEKLNMTAENTKGIQQQLGVKMAMRDHTRQLSNNASLMAVNYTANDKWLKYFQAAYIKTWRSMR